MKLSGAAIDIDLATSKECTINSSRPSLIVIGSRLLKCNRVHIYSSFQILNFIEKPMGYAATCTSLACSNCLASIM